MHDWQEFFGPEGPLAQVIPGFAVRDEQIAMAEEVAAALTQRGRLIVEAGTGVGKTFAYLIPSLVSGRRVIVSTGTRTLQDQLFHRDLPTVARAIGRPVQVALLKGRANYLCLHRLFLAEQEANSRGVRRDLAVALPGLREWALTTRVGDIAEFRRLSDADPVWPHVTSTRDNCLGPKCAEFERCHVMRARAEAQAADIVIVNHHLLMADMVLKEEGFADLLPGADAIIIDEAHQLPEVATHFLGFAVSARQIESLARDLSSEMLASPTLAGNAGAFVQGLERRAADIQQATSRTSAERNDYTQWSDALLESISATRADLADLTTRLSDPAQNSPAFAALKRRTAELAARMAWLIEPPQEDQPAAVRWAQATRSGFSLHYAPVDVAKELGELIDAQRGAWIFTSATLSVAQNFAHFMQRIGVQDARTAQFGSPFDYESQTLLYLPTGLEAPASPRYLEQVIDIALPVLEASGGRAFLLFTSHRSLKAAAEMLIERLGAILPFPILVQGDAPRDTLLDRFREYGNAVLLGTSSFWEGVDVKGAALSVVIIDKLPFAVPDDPVLKARLDAIERRGGNPFMEEQVPQAVIALKQGVGRLIRDTQDFGVVVLCDPRLRSRAYGKIFLKSLPVMPRTSELEPVRQFLQAKLAAVGLAGEALAKDSFE